MGVPGGDWNETVVKVGNGSEGFDVSPDRKEIWVANAHDGTVSIIDVASKQVTQTLAADVGGANRLKIHPDGKLVFVSCSGGPGRDRDRQRHSERRSNAFPWGTAQQAS